MARKQTDTVPYFPHYTEQGKTLFILKSRFGNDGYAFWFQLLELLCREDGHYYDCRNESAWQYLISFCDSNPITVTEILGVLVSLGQIDNNLWQNKIIWCENLVNNLEIVYKKRGRKLPQKPILGDNNRITGTEIINDETGEIIPVTEMRQSKVEYSKVEYSKVDKKKDIKKKNKYAPSVTLTDDEYLKLVNAWGTQGTQDKIDALSLYKRSKGKRYKDDYATILSWDRKDRKDKVTKSNGIDTTDHSKFTIGKYGHMVER